MRSLLFGLAVHLLLVASTYSAEVKNEKDDKMLIMLEFEPIKADERSKRSSVGESVRQERQSPEVPPEYLGLLQQLAAQQQPQQPPQQQASASAQQPQQHLIQQLVVSRDGSRQPTAARYVLTQDGRLLDESSYAALSQQQIAQPQQLPQGFGQAQGLGLVYQQNPLQNTQPQQIPAAPTQPVAPGQRPQISEYARQQQRILQEVRDAPLRAQIAGLTIRTPQRPVQPVPTGPNSQSPQIFNSPPPQPQPGQLAFPPQQQPGQFALPPQQQPSQFGLPHQQQQQQQQQPGQFGLPPQQQPGQFGLPSQFQDPQNPNIIYTPVPVDPQTYQLQLQQQLAAQYGVEADPRQVYAQAQRPGAVSQQLVYQQPIPQEIAQDKIRRPITVLPAQSAAQPQVVPQNLPQQYLIETTKPSTPQPPQYITQDAAPQIQYVQQPVPQQTPIREPEQEQPSTLLRPVAGRGLFTPVKPSKSSIFVSRSSVPKSVSLTISDDVTSEKVPVVRLPPASGQRTLSRQELDALVSAGYTVTPVQDQQPDYLKSKRQPITEERRNHVVYENPQDGVQYQYSPGSSDISATIKTKKEAPESEYFKQL